MSDLINLQTPERVAAAACLIRKGNVFPLDHPIAFINPPMFNCSLPRRSVSGIVDLILDNALDGYSLQVSSQWDSLAHVGLVAAEKREWTLAIKNNEEALSLLEPVEDADLIFKIRRDLEDIDREMNVPQQDAVDSNVSGSERRGSEQAARRRWWSRLLHL
jgi:hypothetical protein